LYKRIKINSIALAMSLFSFVFYMAPSQAAVILEKGMSQIAVAPEMPYFEDQTGSQSFYQAQAQFKRFEQRAAPHDSTVVSLRKHDSLYWFRLPITNNTTDQNWVLHLYPLDGQKYPLRLQEIVVYLNGDSDQPILKTQNSFIPLNVIPGKQSDFLIMVKTIPGIDAVFQPVLKTEKKFYDYSKQQSAHMTTAWVVTSIFVTASLIFFGLSRLPVFLVFAIYAVVLIQGMTLINGINEKLYNILFSIISPAAITAFVAGLVSFAAAIVSWVSLRDKQIPPLLKFITAFTLVISLAVLFSQDALTKLPIPTQFTAHLILVITGAVLSLIALTQSFTDSKKSWLIPAWVIFIVQGFFALFNPLLLPFLHLSLLGTAFTIQVYALWHEQEKLRSDQQQRLQIEMNQVRQQQDKDNYVWERKLESERSLLNSAKQREALRSSQLAEAKQQAEEANKAKSDFLAMITHEIRTPMTGIMGMVSLMAHTPLDEKQKEYIDTVQYAGEALLTLLNDVLDFSKMEKGAIALETIPFTIRNLVQSVITLMSGRANEKSLKLITHIADHVPDVFEGDPNRIRQVLINLLSNAIKFTERGNVTVSIASEKPDAAGRVPVHFKVVDTGIGISKEGQEKLFGAYAQADASISRRFGGTGLGLNICRMLVQAMGGDIEVESELDQGSTFYFTLMLTPSDQSAIHHYQVVQDTGPIDPLHVLVVDDNAVNLKVIAGLLEMDKHIVTTTESGTEAINLVQARDFDLIFMDIQMPDFDGLTVTRAIRRMSNPKKSKVIVYALTGMGRDEDEAACRAAGMNGLLMKPITVPHLKRVLAQVAAAKKIKDGQMPVQTTAESNQEEDDMKLKDVLDKTIDKAKAVTEDVKRTYDEIKEQVRIGLASDDIPVNESGILDEDNFPQDLTTTEKNVVINFANLNELRQSLPAESFMDIYSDLEGKSIELVEQIEAAWKDRDIDDISEKAHNLRGMAGNFGLHVLSKIAERAEKAARNNNKELVELAVVKLRPALNRTIDVLNDWKAQA
jgi:signal transduction histidine kinase/DNA-binding response OmpR family regulator/HPt (histidine-containing phosphotransfer) domain-containing protein